jgi:hypothetical protein
MAEDAAASNAALHSKVAKFKTKMGWRISNQFGFILE